jgi:hypothetical protein
VYSGSGPVSGQRFKSLSPVENLAAIRASEENEIKLEQDFGV